MPTPFHVHLDDAVLDDLRRRLAATRWPDEIENSDWESGTNRRYLQDLCAYWQNEYDWRTQEAAINRFEHFKATVDGTALHFIHEKGRGTVNTPLLLIHGWPDSFIRFLPILPLLTEPDAAGRAFDVVVPSIPGFAFSDKPTQPGMDPKVIAALFTTLMTAELGYPKFIAHGGDWGSTISEQIALHGEEHVLGLHLTDVPFRHGLLPVDNPSAAEKLYQTQTKAWAQTEGAYAQIQSTKPQTVGYGLNDSPAGLAAWIVEKFRAWTDNQGKPEDAVPRDLLLTNLALYWATETATSAMRIYYETGRMMQLAQGLLHNLNPLNKEQRPAKPPAAFALFPKDISKPPKEFAARFFNVQRWTHLQAGGHFTALEQPKLLADDLRLFAAPLTEDKG